MMTLRLRLYSALLSACLFLLMPGSLFADKVKTIAHDGDIELESRRHVQLAGIQLVSESIPVLASLVASADVDVEDAAVGTEALGGKAGARPVYLYVKKKEMGLPSKMDPGAKEEKVMVNQLLLSMGAATVDTHASFKWKEKFSELEAVAKAKGEGVWSYEKSL